MTPDDFDSALAAAKDGAEWALACLYRHLHPRVLRYLRTREPRHAEDLASEVWLDVAAGLARFEGGQIAFRAWVFTIARRRLVDLRRMESRRATVPVPHEHLIGHAERGNAEEEAMAVLGTEAALLRIASLPPDQGEVVLLRVLAELPVREVAAIMGKRPGTIRVLQHRALSRLAQTIEREAVTR